MNNPTVSNQELYGQKKRRILGEVIREAELRRGTTWVSVHKSHKDELMTYESAGLIVSINGSGNLPLDHAQCQDAARLTQVVVGAGGIVMNGGRPTGVMAATTAAAAGNVLGIIFPEIATTPAAKTAAMPKALLTVNAPQPRTELLATCAPIIVVFRGGLGSFQVLMRAIVHLMNHDYHPEQPPQLLFVSSYWIGLLNTMMNLGVLPKEFISRVNLFNSVEDIINAIPRNK